ncbi:hypothetical protein WA016_01067 [Myxococcus stipitatus]
MRSHGGNGCGEALQHIQVVLEIEAVDQGAEIVLSPVSELTAAESGEPHTRPEDGIRRRTSQPILVHELNPQRMEAASERRGLGTPAVVGTCLRPVPDVSDEPILARHGDEPGRAPSRRGACLGTPCPLLECLPEGAWVISTETPSPQGVEAPRDGSVLRGRLSVQALPESCDVVREDRPFNLLPCMEHIHGGLVEMTLAEVMLPTRLPPHSVNQMASGPAVAPTEAAWAVGSGKTVSARSRVILPRAFVWLRVNPIAPSAPGDDARRRNVRHGGLQSFGRRVREGRLNLGKWSFSASHQGAKARGP